MADARPARPNVVPRRRLGRLRLAGDDGGARSGAASRPAAGGESSMTAVEELTALDRAVENGDARGCSSSSIPAAGGSGELESNATMIAEHLFWLHVLGLRDPDTDRRLANDLLARRRDDGTWSNWCEGPADLSTTIESYVALKMAGVDPGAEDAATTSAARAASRAAACSRSASWPSSASGRGSGSRRSRPR